MALRVVVPTIVILLLRFVAVASVLSVVTLEIGVVATTLIMIDVSTLIWFSPLI